MVTYIKKIVYYLKYTINHTVCERTCPANTAV